MGRKRKQEVGEQYQPPSSHSIAWDMAPEEPLNLTRVVIEAMQKLSKAGEGETAIRLVQEYQKVCDALHWHAELIPSYYEIGMVKGFTAARNAPVWPEKGSLADAIWSHLRNHPGITNASLCHLLDLRRREIPVPERYAKELPKNAHGFKQTLKYSHSFQEYLSEQKKAYDRYHAAETFSHDPFPKQNSQANRTPRKSLAFLEADEEVT